ncbi:MAG TPA: DUF2065 family protein [Burkholderiaceae bacterium]
MGTLIGGAVALVMILEGLLPFLNPALWRRLFEQALRLSDAQIRLVGLACLVLGVITLQLFGP